eukprot:259670-Amphidinium_carterae.1
MECLVAQGFCTRTGSVDEATSVLGRPPVSSKIGMIIKATGQKVKSALSLIADGAESKLARRGVSELSSRTRQMPYATRLT